jgi:hypothetical protein
MQTVLVRLIAGDLPHQMGEMRVWLDSRGIAPSSFRYEVAESGAMITVIFKEVALAAAFRDAFRGELGGQTPLARSGD